SQGRNSPGCLAAPGSRYYAGIQWHRFAADLDTDPAPHLGTTTGVPRQGAFHAARLPRSGHGPILRKLGLGRRHAAHFVKVTVTRMLWARATRPSCARGA